MLENKDCSRIKQNNYATCQRDTASTERILKDETGAI
jgi:hypothetical protein